jgi:hypothetical protein
VPTATGTGIRNCRQTDDGFRHQDLVLGQEVERRILELYAEHGVEVEREN